MSSTLKSRKPDPSEPWRYVCPKCHSQVYGKISMRKYRCEVCGESFAKRELFDQAAPVKR